LAELQTAAQSLCDEYDTLQNYQNSTQLIFPTCRLRSMEYCQMHSSDVRLFPFPENPIFLQRS